MALQDAFHRTMFPDQQEIQELASRLQLNDVVVQMWFKNQQQKIVTQQRNYQGNSSLGASNHVNLMKGASSSQAMGLDISQICLGSSMPPWASVPQDIDTLVKMYDLPGDEDPESFDKYLPPGCLD
ncbi:paired-like homeodomain transcription factor LEUTX [Acomys russatus]|uniref:paired-like homeodomain transcription factor LEUTX n=1 Tax=Acomys russatus TaxID=60746 RepID=UPI0021E1E11B|nr:paired-like homeodomain transcription factor LEUTX [Acomys russatus]